VRAVELGRYLGPLRYENVPVIAADVAQALLDLAERHGRIRPGERTAWDAWVAEVLAVIARQPPEGEGEEVYTERLRAVAARPLPE
jgi:hypothetical protein